MVLSALSRHKPKANCEAIFSNLPVYTGSGGILLNIKITCFLGKINSQSNGVCDPLLN